MRFRYQKDLQQHIENEHSIENKQQSNESNDVDSDHQNDSKIQNDAHARESSTEYLSGTNKTKESVLIDLSESPELSSFSPSPHSNNLLMYESKDSMNNVRKRPFSLLNDDNDEESDNPNNEIASHRPLKR